MDSFILYVLCFLILSLMLIHFQRVITRKKLKNVGKNVGKIISKLTNGKVKNKEKTRLSFST